MTSYFNRYGTSMGRAVGFCVDAPRVVSLPLANHRIVGLYPRRNATKWNPQALMSQSRTMPPWEFDNRFTF
jgi:hypothetical protein